jgi:LemA protein
MRRFEAAQGELRSALGRLLAVAENYPQLKANENFRDLQAQLEGTENRIAIARRRYIDEVRRYNDLVTVPPTSWTNAVMYHKQPKAQFSATTPDAQKAPTVKF